MKNKKLKISGTIKQHIINNKREYIVIGLLFVIGIFLGVLFVNNMQETPKQEVSTYFNNYIDKMKETQNIDNMSLLKTSMWQNLLLMIMIWFFGTTVIRNTSGFWYCTIQRLLFRIHYIYMYFDYGTI